MIINALKELFPGNEWSVNGEFGDPDFEIICHTASIQIPEQRVIQAKIDELNLIKAKTSKKAEIDEQVRLLERTPISYNDHEFSCDAISQVALLNAAMSAAEQIEWATEDNGNIIITRADIQNICSALRTRSATLRTRARTKKDEVEALTDIQAVRDFVINLDN